ncbi:hypothetical protein [Erwinia psidii]|uniref:hypothetical protein n=1 Tax=Erwinia psidii TaxID=69224 RepID=UPI000F52FD77|nr:hypothetical protein [Erwinia psidii]MCX8956403.1 hypothetical protein [Erwinia psidii]MCX8959839.1 hypothetical protein [Erwinia psidii]MCX8966470.1 hypothetical protein [Erwinia psidii]
MHNKLFSSNRPCLFTGRIVRSDQRQKISEALLPLTMKSFDQMSFVSVSAAGTLYLPSLCYALVPDGLCASFNAPMLPAHHISTAFSYGSRTAGIGSGIRGVDRQSS